MSDLQQLLGLDPALTNATEAPAPVDGGVPALLPGPAAGASDNPLLAGMEAPVMMARTAPVPDIPPLPGMNPGTVIAGDGGGGSGDGGSENDPQPEPPNPNPPPRPGR